ncbi:hypothetical protein [Sandaracinus amylolyticus]|uniref:hypothetical protein n=1 Tax=Sandaracinus amylolyticus TaxID=927083 RepID=UPI0014701BB9|nr:hypothetical protein [Sandaracinus amylolyticus]
MSDRDLARAQSRRDRPGRGWALADHDGIDRPHLRAERQALGEHRARGAERWKW